MSYRSIQYLLGEIRLEKEAEVRFRIRLHGGEVAEPGQPDVSGQNVTREASEGAGSPGWKRALALSQRMAAQREAARNRGRRGAR